jgi:hypothetical protein
MKSHLVCYATGRFIACQQSLVRSAQAHGIDHVQAWDREALEATLLYRLFRSTLDLPRGSGYWLWKPFIIAQALRRAASGDSVVYADAGIEIVDDLSPLFPLCREQGGVLLFAGHYDDVGAPGPNTCGKWTKRDCFVFMGCDAPAYHRGQMLDASFLVLTKCQRSVRFVRDWFFYCCQTQLLTDAPNVSRLPNLPGFIAHRHDQSILSLLASREKLEVFRHPSQFGNHLKAESYRAPGEWHKHPYGAKGIYENSPYKTLLNHHRGRAIWWRPEQAPQLAVRA